MPSYSKEQLQAAVSSSFSQSEALRRLNLCPKGGSHAVLKKWIAAWAIDTSHFLSPQERAREQWREGGCLASSRRPLQELLVEHGKTPTEKLKQRLYREGVKTPVCELCGQGAVWQGKKMSLVLDHINGVRDDHRIENLRIVCPNCDATLPTFCGRNVPKKRCIDCNRPVGRRSARCSQCAAKIRVQQNPQRNRAAWPADKELALLVFQLPVSTIAARLGVSGVAVKKRCNLRGIETPPRGYWAKKRAKDGPGNRI